MTAVAMRNDLSGEWGWTTYVLKGRVAGKKTFFKEQTNRRPVF